MPLTVTRRRSTGALTITGSVAGQRIRRRAQSNDLQLAREEAATLEAAILRTQWHGERRGASRTLPEAILSYIEAKPRSANEKARLARILRALGNIKLCDVDQDTVTRLRRTILRPSSGTATVMREIVTPLSAVLRHAHRRGWCDVPAFEIPRRGPGRTCYFTPAEAERLIEAAAPHLRPLLVFLIGTGMRMSEALELDWREVDLTDRWASQLHTKTLRRRVAKLPACVVVALAVLPHRTGPVFLTQRGEPYANNGRRFGGQIKTAWRGALRRAGLDPKLTPHDLRHTWASWHYALNRDLLLLKAEGGWETLSMVERYAHLIPAGQAEAIRHFLVTDPMRLAATA
jgi:integrase